jgi:hypothetical protein
LSVKIKTYKKYNEKHPYKRKNALFVRRVRIKSLEKNPIKGGTPAIESKRIVITIKKKLLKLKLLNECKVLN